jgi:hypothetical protein
MAIDIRVRSGTDWSDEAAVNARLPPAFANRVALWSRTFTLPYRWFLHRRRGVAGRGHARRCG